MSHGPIVIFDLSPYNGGNWNSPEDPRQFCRNVVKVLEHQDRPVIYPQSFMDRPEEDTDEYRAERHQFLRQAGWTKLRPLVRKFSDGETDINIPVSVRDADVYVFQSYIKPLGERTTELEYTLDACHGGGEAERVVVVEPYLFGQRGERRTRARQPLPALVHAKSLQSNGAKKVLTICEHAQSLGALYSALDLGYDQLSFELLVANYIKNDSQERGLDSVTLATPDLGASKRVGFLQDILASINVPARVVLANKRRMAEDKTRLTHIIGDVEGDHVYLVDDIGSTLGSAKDALFAYLESGAVTADVLLGHAVLAEGFEGSLDELCDKDQIENIIFANTLPLKGRALTDDKVRIIPFEPFVAEAIWRINQGQSISGLHDHDEIAKVYRRSQIQKGGKFIEIK